MEIAADAGVTLEFRSKNQLPVPVLCSALTTAEYRTGTAV